MPHPDAPADVTPSSTPPRRVSRGGRVLRWTAGVFGVLVLAVVACEVAGWPFLAKPVERALSDTLKREVLLRAADDSTSTQGATVRFLGGLKVQVPLLQIGAPVWSQKPYFLHAEGARMRLSYAALWRAKEGKPLDIDVLHADRLTVHAERLKDGRASWQFGDPNAPPPPADETDPLQLPTVRELTVRDGHLTYKDVPLRADITGDVQLNEGTLADNTVSGLFGSAQGTYGNAAVKAKLTAAGAMPLLASVDGAPPTPVELDLKAGKAALHFKGTVSDVLRLGGMSGAFRVTGPSLGAVGEPLGVTLPTTGAFDMRGRIVKQGEVWRFVADRATVGTSQLTAALTFDPRGAVPMLSGEVRGPRLMLVDLAPSIGAEPAPAPGAKPETPGPKVLPDREFDLPSLRAMNANVLMKFENADLGSLFARPLSPLQTHLTLRDGVLRLDDIVARTADGTLRGEVSLDGSGKIALWRTDLRWNNVRLERWIAQDRANDAPPYVAGRLVGRAQLKGQGKSTAEILSTLDGSVRTSLRDGKISQLAIEAAGIDVAQALGVVLKGDRDLPVQCALVDLNAEKGVFRPRAMVVETTDSNVWVDGSVSLRDEKLDLRAVVSPKDFSPLTLRTPVHVKGTFSDPAVSLEKAPLARKAALAVLLGLIHPVAAVIPLLDPGSDDGHDEECSALLKRARQAAEGPLPAGTTTAAAPVPRRAQ